MGLCYDYMSFVLGIFSLCVGLIWYVVLMIIVKVIYGMVYCVLNDYELNYQISVFGG